MDIEFLSSLVKRLILSRDKVSVPGLGCFVAELVPASFADKGYSITPPYRSLSFKSMDYEDSLIAQTASKDKSISLQEASAELSILVEEIKKELQQTGTVELPGLGKLRQTSSGAIIFVSDPDLDIYPEGFGLETVSLKNRGQREEIPQEETPQSEPIELINPDEMVEPVVEEPKEPEKPEEPKAKRRLPIAVIVLIAIVAVLALALIVFRLMAVFAPEFIDSILYTPEELEMLKSLI